MPPTPSGAFSFCAHFFEYNGSMLDYSEDTWKQPCPKVNCRKKQCECGLEFVAIPAALASEMTPKNGAFANAIVRYEDTGEIWIYDKNGVPVQIKEANG